MDEPRLFEVAGPVVAIATTVLREPAGWALVVSTRREQHESWVDAEHYLGLSWEELLDVLTAHAWA